MSLARGRILTTLPPAGAGQRIGLFGGSFDPPHAGHRHVCVTALRRLHLDWIWWLVTPGNPLKDWRQRTPLAQRLIATAQFVRHPKFQVTGFEAAHGLHFSALTIAFLRRRRPDLNFVWLMGADSLIDFHSWYRWQDIFHTVPIAVVVRPGSEHAALRSKAAIAFGGVRLDAAAAAVLPTTAAPAWTLLPGPTVDLSSTGLRESAAPLKR